MFKEIAKFLFNNSSESSQWNEGNQTNLASTVRDHFKEDYIENKDFLESSPPAIRDSLEELILSTYQSSSKFDDDITGNDPVYHIFHGLKALYIQLWLAETGYGEKLALKMEQLLYTDDYGDTCFDDWNSELNKFVSDRLYKLDSYLLSSIPKKYQEYSKKLDLDYLINVHSDNPDHSDSIEDIAFTISLYVDEYHEQICSNSASSNLDDIENPYEYEQAVANEFIALGWEGYPTSGSGDQGADVIVEKNGVKLIVQCKLYSSPVGNKAVQEVSAAKGFYKGDISAVITNNDFTKSARQLADSLNVYLLHHSQITALNEILFEEHEDSESLERE